MKNQNYFFSAEIINFRCDFLFICKKNIIFALAKMMGH